MPTENFFVRVPPDSTGKRIRNRADLVLDYVAGTRGAGIGFFEGEIVNTPSGLRGIVYQSTDATVGTVHILLTGSAEAALDTEAIRTDVGNSTIANASGTGVTYYSQATLIAGGNDLGNLAHVNEQGALKVQTAAGPQEDAFGRLRTSDPTTLADYVLTYDDLPNLFETTLTGATASSDFDSDISGVILTTGTASGDKVSRRSNIYHPYQAGISKLIEMTVIVSDIGKANVRRRWGYFDDNDGLFFQLDGTTLSVVTRSSTSGSPADTVVAQSDWNKDQGNGTGDENNPSGITLDVSTNNIYWIDFQWLGAGRVRFGMRAPTGEIVILHEFRNANSDTVPYMKTGTLPVSWEQENTAAAGSSSQLRVICTGVIDEGPFNPYHTHFGFTRETLITAESIGGSNVPLLSFRLRASHLGLDNRGWMLPTNLEIFGIAGTAPTLIAIELTRNPALTAATFAEAAGSAVSMVDLDVAATNATGGIVLLTALISPTPEGTTIKTMDLTEVFETASEVVSRRATITASSDIFTIQARALAGSAQLVAALSWEEIL